MPVLRLADVPILRHFSDVQFNTEIETEELEHLEIVALSSISLQVPLHEKARAFPKTSMHFNPVCDKREDCND